MEDIFEMRNPVGYNAPVSNSPILKPPPLALLLTGCLVDLIHPYGKDSIPFLPVWKEM
jgi:hypothetical protein